MSIFYTEVPKKVRDALSLRKQYYNAGTSVIREEGSYAWLYRKMAYVNAQAVNPNTKKSNSLTVPKEGGLGASSLYKSNPNANYIPRPHINTVKISSDGDFGSLRKCELAFTVYTLTDLDAYQPFLDLGATLLINYGWSAGGSAAGSAGHFKGVIYNFTYSVNDSGGFDCITYGIAEGSSILPVNITAGLLTNVATQDILGNVTISINVANVLQELANKSSVNDTYIDNDGIGKDTLKNSLTDPTSGIAPANYYITLEKFIGVVNNNLLRDFYPFQLGPANTAVIDENLTKQLPWYLRGDTPGSSSTVNKTPIDPKDFLIVCNEEYTKGLVPKTITDLVSANPSQIIFPGYATYGSTTYFKGASEYIEKFRKGDLSKMLLNINWLKTMFAEIGTETQDRQKSADQSISKVLLNIFNAISDNSGSRFKLSMVSDPENSKRFLIADINYVDKSVNPYILTAVNNKGICRRVSLTSKVPAEMAMVAFVARPSTATTTSSVAGEVLNGLKLKVDTNAIVTARDALKKCAAKFGDSTVTQQDVSALQASLKQVYEFVPMTSVNLGVAEGRNAIPFPIDFSATLDGIEGLQFGNTVTTNYLPSIYKNTRVAFTVTKVDHNIQANDWTTTISTVCRLIPDDKNESTENNYLADQQKSGEILVDPLLVGGREIRATL
jgi:hypothetical protein